jgi:hypothetical protein
MKVTVMQFTSRVDVVHNTNLDVLELLDEHEEFRAEAKLIRRRLARAYRVLMTEPENQTFRERYLLMTNVIGYYMDIASED